MREGGGGGVVGWSGGGIREGGCCFVERWLWVSGRGGDVGGGVGAWVGERLEAGRGGCREWGGGEGG